MPRWRSPALAARPWGRAGQRVNVEFVSANPTGPMHVGHARGAVFGDALAGLLAFAGYEVTREYYINDGGAQVDVLARSAYERYREACGHAPRNRRRALPGDYLIAVGEALKARFGDSLLDKGEQYWLADVREIATAMMMDMIKMTWGSSASGWMSIPARRRFTGTGKIEHVIDRLRALGLIYEGRLDPPKGKLPEDWEDRVQTLFRSTAFAMTSTGRSGNPTAPGPTSPPTLPITGTRSNAATAR